MLSLAAASFGYVQNAPVAGSRIMQSRLSSQPGMTASLAKQDFLEADPCWD